MSSMEYDIVTIKEIIDGEFLHFHSKGQIYELTTDSRQSLNSGFLFFAIVSGRNDGHKYIENAYHKGVRNFVVSKPVSLDKMGDANVINVDNALESMQQLVKSHRANFSIPIVGITGSNGKTTVKEWLYQLLQNKYKIIRSPKSYNSQIGVPLSVWRISKEDELGIFEAGISMRNEMQALQEIIQPTLGVLTNIGDAHRENFNSTEEIVQEKAKLFAGCETLIYCKDEVIVDEAFKKLKAKKIIAWSLHDHIADHYVSRIDKKGKTTDIHLYHEGKSYSYKIPFTDEASIENSISCFFVLASLNAISDSTLKRMEDLQAVAMRLEIKSGINGSLLINDSYNSDLHSLKIALQLLSQHNQYSRKMLILSDIVQVSEKKDELYKEVARLVKESGVDAFIGIGEDIVSHMHDFPQKSSFYLDAKQFVKEFDTDKITDSAILIKGARKYGLEKVSDLLQQKSHETILEINLNHAIDNLNYFRSLLRNDTKVMAMVKALSYGAGSIEIAKILQFHQIDFLGVAYTDEGSELRRAGISVPIMVMNPEIESFETIIRDQLEPEIYSFRVLHKFMESLSDNQYFASSDEPYPIHIKLDTGMHRLGFEEADILQLIKELNECKSIRVVSLFSHLASAEDSSHDEFTRSQLSQFKKMSDELMEGIGYRPMLHVLNSNGIIRFPGFQLDMVRVGIGLYGIVEDEAHQRKLKNVSSMKTHISQIRELKAGETVGYSRKGVKEKAGKIATIPIGYADGLNRSLGNGNWHVQIGNRLFPTIGMICMDMCMIDLLDSDVEEGQEVVVFGGKKSIKDVANSMGKSSYEVLTGISSRVKRIYFFE